MLKNILDKIFGKKKKGKLICQRCRKEIDVPSYVLIKGEVVSNSRSPQVFTCPEQAFNYAQRIAVHDTCWVEMLKEYGSPVYDMGKVYEEYKKKKRGTKFSELK